MEDKSKGKKIWEHLASVMRIQNKNPGCPTCFSPIMDEKGRPIASSIPKKDDN